MANAGSRTGLGLVALALAASVAFSDEPQEWRADLKVTGQEYQQQIDAAVQLDGSWTAVWLDYRLGHPALYSRTFDPDDNPSGPGTPLTDGRGLFGTDLNALPLGDPAVAPLNQNRTFLVWREDRGGVSRIRAAVLSGAEIEEGPITVREEGRIEALSDPQVSVSGDRALVTWTHGQGRSARLHGQIFGPDLTAISSSFRIHSETTMGHRSCRLTAVPGGWVAIWQEYVNEYFEEVLLRRISTIAQLPEDPIAVDERPDWDQGQPAIVAADGGVFTCWIASKEGTVNLYARQYSLNLEPVAGVFLAVDEGATVTPRDPKAVATTDTTVLVVWTAGPASRARFHARQILLPDQPMASYVVVEDPDPPAGSTLVPRAPSLCGSPTTPLRLLWHDDRDGWDLVYKMHLSPSGTPVTPAAAVEIADGTASQILPAVAMSADDQGIAAWGDFRTGNLTVYATLLGEQGKPRDSAFRVSETTGGSVTVPATNLVDLIRNRPTAAALADGRSVVAWTTILPGGISMIYMQLVDSDGELLGNNTALSIAGADGSQPDIAAQPDGSYFVVWRVTTGDGGDILAQRYLSDGTALDDTIRVADRRYQTASQIRPAIASSGSGEVVIAWLDDRQGNGYDVYAQRLGPTGQKILTNTLMSQLEFDPIPQMNPDVAAAPDRYVVVWDENPLGRGNISGLLVTLPTSASGKTLAAEQTPFSIAAGEPGFKYPSVAMAPSGRFVVTYWDTSNDRTRMISQRFSMDAIQLGPAYDIPSVGEETDAIPGGVAADSDSILYAWSDNRDATGWTTMIRKVSWHFGGITAVTTTTWSVTAEEQALVLRWSVPIFRAGSFFWVWRATNDHSDPGGRPGADAVLVTPNAITSLEPGGTDYLFRDTTVEPGISFSYWIEDQEGEFGGPWTGSLLDSRGSLHLRALDNPFTESVRIAWSAPSGANPSLAIYDVRGRCVRTAPRTGSAGGIGEWIWDGQDEARRPSPAGLYWARLTTQRMGERSIQIVHLR